MASNISLKDLELIHHLRNDSSKKFSIISRELNMPVTTLYYHYQKLMETVIQKNISLIDFKKIGFPLKSFYKISSEFSSSSAIEHLKCLSTINSIYELDDGSILAEGISRNKFEARSIADILKSKFHINDIDQLSVLNEVQKEAFLTKREHINLII